MPFALMATVPMYERDEVSDPCSERPAFLNYVAPDIERRWHGRGWRKMADAASLAVLDLLSIKPRSRDRHIEEDALGDDAKIRLYVHVSYANVVWLRIDGVTVSDDINDHSPK